MSYLFVYKHSNDLICCLFNRDAMFVLVHTAQCSNVLAFGNMFMFRHVAFYVQLDMFLKGINFLNVMYSLWITNCTSLFLSLQVPRNSSDGRGDDPRPVHYCR